MNDLLYMQYTVQYKQAQCLIFHWAWMEQQRISLNNTYIKTIKSTNVKQILQVDSNEYEF